jgi:hypothetical protein
MTEPVNEKAEATPVCPFCGARRNYVSEHGSVIYDCLVIKRIDEEPEQTRECRILQLEQQIEELKAAIAATQGIAQ